MDNTKQPTGLRLILTLAVSLLVVGAAVAQDASKEATDKDRASDKKTIIVKKTGDGDANESVRVEMKNGQVWVNGEQVPEGEDLKGYLPKGFDAEILDGDNNVWISDDSEWVDDDGERKMMLRGRRGRFLEDGGNEFFVEGRRPGAGFRNRDGAELEDLIRMTGDAGVPAVSILSRYGGAASSPEIIKLELESRKLGRRLSQSEGAERTELSKELDELLASIFDKKTELRRERMEKLQSELAEERETIQQRMGKRQQIIADRKAELTGESRKDDW